MMKLKNIWGKKHQENFFRKEVILADKPKEAFVRIFCDTGYEFFINGRLVANCDEWCNTRDYAVKIYLTKGKNVIAVHGINHGGHRALAFELVVDGNSVCVSDKTWKYCEEECWGWQLQGYDDSMWDTAYELDLSAAGGPQWWTRPGSEPERILYPQDNSQFFTGNVPKGCETPYYTKKEKSYSPDERVIKVLGKDYKEYTQRKTLPEIVSYSDIIESDVEDLGNKVVIDKTDRYTGPVFVVDMGKEVVGHFRMKIQSESPVSFRLYYGETLDDTIHEMPRDICQYRMLNEEYRLSFGKQEFEARTKTAFRYVRVEFFDCESKVTVSDFSARTTLYPVNKRGWFKCSDEKINKLWEMSERTVHYCMQEYIIDAPRRDRFLWTGDVRLEGLFNFWLYADTELYEYSLECIEKMQYPNGAIPSSYGEGCSTLWDYIAWYIICYDDYYMHTGNAEFVKKHLKSITSAMEYLISLSDESGLICVPENPLGNLWMVVLSGYVGYDPFLNELYFRALETVSRFTRLFGEDNTRYNALIDKIRPEIIKNRKEHAIERTFNLTDHVSIQYEMAEEYIKEKDIQGMLKRLNRYWGIMVDSHSDCVHEGGYAERDLIVVDEKNADCWLPFSYCHGWTAAAVSFLPMGVLGVRTEKPGFKEITIEPFIDGFGFFKGAIPTPYGEIAIKYENNELSYFIPDEIMATLVINEEKIDIQGSGTVKIENGNNHLITGN